MDAFYKKPALVSRQGPAGDCFGCLAYEARQPRGHYPEPAVSTDQRIFKIRRTDAAVSTVLSLLPVVQTALTGVSGPPNNGVATKVPSPFTRTATSGHRRVYYSLDHLLFVLPPCRNLSRLGGGTSRGRSFERCIRAAFGSDRCDLSCWQASLTSP
jgi:hypothetical protein